MPRPSEWSGEVIRRGGASDTVARAREARQARLAGQTEGTTRPPPSLRAASSLQLAARRFLVARRSRKLNRGEWDACFTSHAGSLPLAGQQLALSSWLLRFFDPRFDEARLGAIVTTIREGMENPEPEKMLASAGANRWLALTWLDVLRRLLLALGRLLAEAPSLPSAAEASLCSAALAEIRKQHSSRFGPSLRLLLLMSDPDSWKLVQQLSPSPSAQALCLLAHSALASASVPLVSSLGAFSRRFHFHLDPALLAATSAIASRSLAPQQPTESPARLAAALVFGLLRVPALTSRLPPPALERLRKEGEGGGRVWALLTEHGPAIAARVPSVFADDPDGALCVGGNLLSIWVGGRVVGGEAVQVAGGMRLLEGLFSVCASAAGGGSSCFHQLRGWALCPPAPELRDFLGEVQSQLMLLWSPLALRLVYTPPLFSPVSSKPVDKELAALGSAPLPQLAARAQLGAAAHIAALRALPPLRPRALASLAYSSHLVACLWALLRRLPAAGGARGAGGAGGVLKRLLGNMAQVHEEPLLPLLLLMVEGITHLLPVLDDHELFTEQHPFSPHDLSELSAFLNELAFSLTWEAPPSPSLPPASADAAKQLRESVLRLLSLLTERDARRAFCPPGAWLVRRLSLPQLRREMGEKKPRARSLLSTMPWAVPFEERVNVFRDLVSAEKASLPGEQMPEHLKGKHIKVRRASVLEDGYVQLSAGDAQQLKGTIRVEFVSELGLPEAGIDRTGVFKEFLEEVIAKAFDADRGLFAHTPAQRIYPSPNSELADPNHLRLFEFIGRMLGKALYEGIVLDLPLADFFVAKFLGKHNSLDELPSLDEQLFSSLDLLKRYDGDVENDLCLTFVVDEEVFGERRQVELRDGGRSIPVTRDNRIEYVHLMADYRLNKQIGSQSRAIVSGLGQVVPAGWLRFFSTPELQRLIGGDDVAIDVADLKRHTRYAGGYNDFSPTVRDFWAVVGEFSREERGLLLKFVTSCSKPPLLGFAHMQPQFTIQCVSAEGSEMPSVLAFLGMGRRETGRLPTSATCFNLLKLPNFKSKKLLRDKLLYAIKSAAGFELS